MMARNYHEGNQGVNLTGRLQMFLKSYGQGHEFNLNVCRSVITAMTERLSIIGFDSKPEIITWAAKVWADNLMAAIQDDVYEKGLRDGECFVIVAWDKEESRVRWTLHERYVSSDSQGNDFGCVAKYEQNDPNQKLKYVTKYWTEDDDVTKRKTEYYPDKVKKYRQDAQGEWQPFSDPSDPEGSNGVIDWKDAENKPLGIPVIHFKNKNLRCEAWDAFPLQDAINKGVLDLLSAGDATAFRIFVALGFIPTTDGKPPAADRSNWQQIEPGEIVATEKSPQEADFKAIDAADLTPLQDLAHQLIMWLAMVTETPITRFITTKLIASDETLKEQDNPLLSRVYGRQVLFGSAWSQCLKMSRKLERLWGDKSLDPEVDIKLLWKDAQVRGEKEKLENLGLKQDIGVTQSQLWKEAGYDQSTIDTMKADKEKEDGNAKRDGRDVQTGSPSRPKGSDTPAAGNEIRSGQK